MWQVPGCPCVGAYGWVAGIASHGSVLLPRAWLITVESCGHPINCLPINWMQLLNDFKSLKACSLQQCHCCQPKTLSFHPFFGFYFFKNNQQLFTGGKVLIKINSGYKCNLQKVNPSPMLSVYDQINEISFELQMETIIFQC